MKMRKVLISIMLLTIICVRSIAGSDDLMHQLNGVMQNAAKYEADKIKQIESYHAALKISDQSPGTIFRHYEKLYEAYKVYNYDSAYTYALRLTEIANHLENANYQAAAKLRLSFILLSGGLFKETYDSLASLPKNQVPDSLKGTYYSLWARYYYDLAGYVNDYNYSFEYDRLGNTYIDTALHYFVPESFEYKYYAGLKALKTNKLEEGLIQLEQLLNWPELSKHQLAITASTLSTVYLQRADTAKAIELLVRASIADIQSTTKETVAIFHLAVLLYQTGDLRHASMCIEGAIANAKYYGARQRQLQVSTILPLIEGERIAAMEAQKAILIKYAVVVTILVLALIALSWIISRQIRKLKHAKSALSLANAAQKTAIEQLQESNRRLEELNDKLEEVNKIKEEYIGYFFNADSEFYNKLDKIKSTIEQKIKERRYEDITYFLNKIDTRKEKEELLLSFDRIFLKLFPNFVQEINALLHPEEQIVLREGELLNTDLRIYALTRLGVTDPEKIAGILGYSVKTIYSYKSRIRNKSRIPVETFEDEVMKIKTI
jgi:type II secretory pathway pseudopilin PulG